VLRHKYEVISEIIFYLSTKEILNILSTLYFRSKGLLTVAINRIQFVCIQARICQTFIDVSRLLKILNKTTIVDKTAKKHAAAIKFSPKLILHKM